MRHFRLTSSLLALGFFFLIGLSTLVPQAITPAAAYTLGGTTPYTYIPKSGVIDSDEVMYFIQVSDIHVNMNYEKRLKDFDQLCSIINSTIKPAFVMATGDLTDADEQTVFMFYTVTEAEYKYYNETLQKYNFTSDFWYSGMGNHEGYHQGNERPMWYKYIRNETQYAVDVKTAFGTYRMVMMDTNEDYGSNDFFNLNGEMKTDKLNQLEALLNSDDTTKINQTVLLGHHPSNEISPSYRSASGKTFKDLMMDGPASVYLNGHIHFDDLYINRGKITELHCPSLKEDRREYRIAAFDHGLFSFSDVKLDQWPAIVITNPTDSQFYNSKMPLANLRTQTEIRSLIFTNGSVTKTDVKIDGKSIGTLTAKGNNLYGLNWTPSEYANGEHTLEVSVETSSGNAVKSIVFSLDGEATPLRQYGSAWLWYAGPMRELFIVIFVIFAIFGLVQLAIPQIIKKKDPARFQNAKIEDFTKPGLSWKKRVVDKRVYQAAMLPKSWLVMLSLLSFYVFFGPFFIGDFRRGVLGSMWFYGIFSEGFIVRTGLCLMVAVLVLIGGVGFSSYVIGSYKTKVRFRNQIPGVVYFGVMIALIIFQVLYNGALNLFLNPILYMGAIITGYLIYQLRKTKTK